MFAKLFRGGQSLSAAPSVKPTLETLEARETPSGLTQQLENEVVQFLQNLGQSNLAGNLPAELRVIEQDVLGVGATPGGAGNLTGLLNQYVNEFKTFNPQLFVGGSLQLSALFGPNGQLNNIVLPITGSLDLNSVVNTFRQDKALDLAVKDFVKGLEAGNPQLFQQLLTQLAGSLGLQGELSHIH